jgi:hypothetical protein
MATAALVSDDIEVGRRVAAAMARGGIPVSVYLWAYIPQLQEWQLFIATPLVDTKGPIAAYAEVEKALQKSEIYDEVPLRRIFLRSPQDRTLKMLEKQSRSVAHEDFRVVNASVAGSFVEDAYLYSGSIHIVQLQSARPAGSTIYTVIHAPYAGPGGAAPAVRIEGIEKLRTFLEERLHIAADVVDSALRRLDQLRSVSIGNVELKNTELRRLGLT